METEGADEAIEGADEAIDTDEAPEQAAGEGWALDTALGAASLVARTIGSVGASPPARVAADVTRFLTRPLAREGHEVREQLEEEATPAAKRIVAQVTPRVTEVVDINEVLAGVDLDALLDNIDLNQLLSRVDLTALLETIDLDRVLARIDVDALLDRLDVDAVVGKVDIAALLDRVDVGAIVDRVDVDGVVARVDIGALIARVDVNAIVADIDVEELVGNTEIGGLIAKSTSGVASTALDAARSHGVTLDRLVARWVNRLMRRDPDELPLGPPLLVAPPPRSLNPGTPEEAA